MLKKIYEDFLFLERVGQDKNFPADALRELQSKLRELAQSEDPHVARLSRIADHLHPEMTQRHLANFILPIERMLNKNLRDDQFLVTSHDKTRAKQATVPLVIVIDNMRSAFNVGSILRTAECLQVQEVILTGYTPTPDQENVQKTAMGTDSLVKWSFEPEITDCLQHLKDQGFQIMALETSQKAESLYSDFAKKPTAFVIGNERWGLDINVLALADKVIEIPCRGEKNSLNAGVAMAIAGFEWVRQWRS